MGSATVPTTGTVPLFTIPASLCNVTFYNLGTGSTVFVGTSTAVSSLNGLQCHSIPTSFFTYVGNKGATFYGTQFGGAQTAATTINYIITTDF
jgi:hypothetical protein